MNRKITAALLSGLACPGAGQFYNRHYIKGASLAAAVLVILSILVYRTWDGMLDAAMSLPPDETFKDLFGLARRVLAADRKFYDTAVTALVAVWFYSIIDAYMGASKKS